MRGDRNPHPPLHPPVFLSKVTRILGPLLSVDGRALREPATHFYWSTGGENQQLASICRQPNNWGVSADLIPSVQGLYMPNFFIFLFLTGKWSHFSSFLHILPLKQYKGWISIKVWKQKLFYTKCLWISNFFQNFTFIGSSVICLSLSEIPIWTHQRQFGLNLSHMAYFVLFIIWPGIQLEPHMKKTFEQWKTIMVMS